MRIVPALQAADQSVYDQYTSPDKFYDQMLYEYVNAAIESILEKIGSLLPPTNYRSVEEEIQGFNDELEERQQVSPGGN